MNETARYVVYERDTLGVPFAVEVIEAERWDATILDPPLASEADARVVRLRRGGSPSRLPRWLSVVTTTGQAGVGEERARYLGEAPEHEQFAVAEVGDLGRSLWPWSPYYRGPSASLAEFIAAGAAAVRHPGPVPAERERRLELIASFCRRRAEPFASVAALRAEALERHLHQAFGDPDAFADALLIERVADREPEVADELRFLRDAEVPAAAHEHSELAIDRRVLLAQATPWRHVEGSPFAAPLAAVRAWRRRYEPAYTSHYRAVVARADEVRRELEAAGPAADALERLDGIARLGPPAGTEALGAYGAALAALEELPDAPEAGRARTAGVVLGREPVAFVEADAAIEGVRAALEVQRQRIASSAVRLVLGRPGVEPLDQLLQALSAGDLEGLERVLDDALAAHIDRLLADAARSPLVTLMERYPEVDAASLAEVVEAFRALLDAAMRASEDGRASLR